MRYRPTIKHRRTPNRGTRHPPPHHGCTGEKYFAPTCAIDAQSPARYDRAPAVRRRTTDVRARNISPLRAPTISIRPTIKHRHTPNRGARPIRRRTMDVQAKYFSPARARLMRHRPHVVIAHPPCAAAPWMYGRKIYRPYVCQRCPVTQPSNINMPQIVVRAQCNNAPHV